MQKMESKINLNITSVNVNSFNVSTAHQSNAKCFLKVEGITSKKADIILITDCRLNGEKKKIEELMAVNLNCSYKLYTNSTKESRGVAIAIKNTIQHEIITEFRDVINENYLIVKLKILEKTMGVGVVYGPNHNDREFFREIKHIYDRLLDENLDVVLGGDFNTVLDRDLTIHNKDLENRLGRE